MPAVLGPSRDNGCLSKPEQLTQFWDDDDADDDDEDDYHEYVFDDGNDKACRSRAVYVLSTLYIALSDS